MKAFVYSFHKAGTMFLYRYFKELARLSEVSYFSINNQPPNQDSWKTASGDFIVCPFRIKGEFVQIADPSSINIIHLRNPIDVLISQYFSFGWTHVSVGSDFEKRRNEIRKKSIDEYCLEECKSLAEKYRSLMRVYEDIPHKILSDYSLMSNDFKKWNALMCRSLSVPLSEIPLYEKFKHEFGWFRKMFNVRGWRWFILKGVSTAHRRDGSDNQKKKYLKPQTILAIETEMKDVLDFFRYFKLASQNQHEQKA